MLYKKSIKSIPIILTSLLLCSCATFYEGVTTALYKSFNMDTNDRKCQIDGPSFNGVFAEEDNKNDSITKILVVHGIGGPGPGHSKRLIRNVINKLNLNRTFGTPKIISIASEDYGDDSLGQLTVSRYGLNKKPSLIVYELTWSDITDQAREALSFDTEKYGYMRADVNRNLKEFVNNHLTDPMIFLGGGREKIIESVQQAFCWMVVDDWTTIVDGSRNYCNKALTAQASTIINDRFILISHSLGSSIMLGAIEDIADSFNNDTYSYTKEITTVESPTNIEILKDKSVTFFMLANQLALLNLASPAKEMDESLYSDYCETEGSMSNHRFLGKLNIVAFSDPNDLLTYTIEPDFAQKYINANVCPVITNILINVTDPIDLKITGLANPQDAHTEYSADERVIDLIVNGTKANSIYSDGERSITKQSNLQPCNWLEVVSNEY